MERTLRKKGAAFGLAIALAMGVTGTAYAATFGNNLNGASSVEVLQVKYNGAAWNYPGSGYQNAWFKYHRNGRTLMQKYAYNGKVTGSVWDNLYDWSKGQTTQFTWGCG
ncbi:hypothetical protein [Corynebacterium cystitidis]|uniref:hypothetical protein n=1 Tax=Corynebacterium cystitidis TaxID=35757 RepID=UPI00211DFEA8|nr:hypothetical protein [Corynebacterium cystitidis]